VSVLDGGLPAWLAAGGPLETEERRTAADFKAHPAPAMVVDAAYVQARSASTTLIDSRAPDRFRGDTEPLDWKAGHIPGAINRNWADSLREGHWKTPDEQRERFEQLQAADEIIVYCGSGVSAAGNLLALELAGFSNAKLYAGSWSDWISDDARPVATGTA
jgi:thiosulfate/3-mercaptopyruvate sulfurtransferase